MCFIYFAIDYCISKSSSGGAYGDVKFYAKKSDANIKMAVKILKPEKNYDVQNQCAELKEVDSLRSKYIISILGFDIDHSGEVPRVRIYMEFCDEGDLEGLLPNPSKVLDMTPYYNGTVLYIYVYPFYSIVFVFYFCFLISRVQQIQSLFNL